MSKKFKVVITDREYESIENELRILSEIDAEVMDYQYKDEEDIVRVAKNADALIIQYAKMPASLINQLDNCKIIARYATGFDGIDLKAATERGIYVCNVPDYCRDEVSSHAMALIMEMSRRVDKYNKWTHQGNWFSMPGKQHNLRDQVIGVIGFGRIAKSFIDKAKTFCDNIWVYDEYVSDQDMVAYGVSPKSLDEIYANADYISIHCPLTDETRHMFNKDVFNKMKNTAILVNVARGAVVSENDLIDALKNGEIGGACLDVLETEPPSKENPLFEMENVIITPHTAWYSVESQKRLQSTPAEAIVRLYKGEIPLYVVNTDVIK